MAGIYIHIPFCKKACHYCDFHFSTNTDRHTQLVRSLGNELMLQRKYLEGEKINTIYFGGGTPSLLSWEEINDILIVVYKTFEVASSPEITLEANPDDLTPEKLTHLKSAGINRLSIGIQSFDDSVLSFLNRAHNSKLAIASFQDARDAGFQNISVDLMYAIPGQDVLSLKRNIEHILALNPEHISAYALTIEEKTVFGKWAAAKKISPPDNDASAHEFTFLRDQLEQAEFDHYEVSNFSKPGYISQHNSNYWKGENYLGVGPSAHSYNGHSRQSNISNNQLYLNSIQINEVPATIEILSREDKINDWLLTTLRTSWGTDLGKLRREYQYDLLNVHSQYVYNLIENRYAVLRDESLILTKSGRLLADKIASDLFQ